MNDTTRDEPMAGLAEWLRNMVRATYIGRDNAEQVLRWAEAVESRRAACSSLPDGPVADERAALICREVAELPDRSSPEDWPEAMLVTHDELRAIVLAALAAPSAQPSGAPEVQERSLSELAHILQYAAYSWGFEAGKVGEHVDTTLAGNRAAAALDSLMKALTTLKGQS